MQPDERIERVKKFVLRHLPSESAADGADVVVAILTLLDRETEAAVNAEAAKHADCCVDREELTNLTARLAAAELQVREMAEAHMYCDGLIGTQRVRAEKAEAAVEQARGFLLYAPPIYCGNCVKDVPCVCVPSCTSRNENYYKALAALTSAPGEIK